MVSKENVSSERLRHPYEGQLFKYTNVMKGWQYRWFVLDPDAGVLSYYLHESERKQRPRGSVHLAAAVISPSDEDSNTFTVNFATGEIFKLRAADARDRHEWVSRIRAIAEMHTLAIAQCNPPLPPREHHSHVGSTMTLDTGGHSLLAVLDSFTAVKEQLQRAESSCYKMHRAVEDLPSSGNCTRNTDQDMLLLKATACATTTCLSQCLSILQQLQQQQYMIPPHTTSLFNTHGISGPTHHNYHIIPTQTKRNSHPPNNSTTTTAGITTTADKVEDRKPQ